jgi:ATP/maltotriose-dependent transcriptional regulator MalT
MCAVKLLRRRLLYNKTHPFETKERAMEKPTIHQLAWSSSRQVSELAAGESTVMLNLTGEMTGIDHTPLITTKLHMPRPRTQLVSRSQLAERLQQGMTDALTLVSAPAGFGKTTVLAQWLAESGTPAAWLSLEPDDNEPVRFLSYLIATLQTLDPSIGVTALSLLRTPQPAPPETVLARLVNDLMTREAADFALVLDDYHVITAEAIHRLLISLVEHLPPQMHLIIATRADPPLPLARLRARGQLTEVRVADLRFTREETQRFLQRVMHIELAPQDLAILQSRTEGWIAGLQFAGLSLQGRSDVTAFLTAFTGSHRFVLDYLSEEVFTLQSPQVQSFLLQTCILNRLSGPLCDAVTEEAGGQAMLEYLERANLFLISLDDQRQWYRYHHLFAEVLHGRLQQTQPSLLPEVHRRASTWFEQHALLVEAVHHALAAPDVERVSDLIEQHGYSLALHGQVHTMLGWFNRLPDALILMRPRLCSLHAFVLLLSNQIEASSARLHDVERGIERAPSTEDARTMLGQVALTRGYIALYSGDVEGNIEWCRQALELLPEAETGWWASSFLGTARAYLVSGEATSAVEERVEAAVALARASGNLVTFLSSISLLARLQVLQGRLRTAASTYGQAMQVTPERERFQTLVNSADYYFGMGDLLREWNELDEAERHLLQGMDLARGTLTVYADIVTLGYTALARLQQARGNFQGALATLSSFAELAYQRHFVPRLLARAAAVQAELEVANGNLEAALRWVEESDLSASDEEISYPREREYLSLARVCITQGRADPAGPFLQDALQILVRLLQDAERKACRGSVIEILMLQALALQALAQPEHALATLERALVLAEPEGYMRLFLDEGPAMLALLRLAHARGLAPTYLAMLLVSAGEQAAATASHPTPRSTILVEPLTERELEVLHLIAVGASNEEIAEQLVIAIGTVKRHVSNIFGKLTVSNRTQAVARAQAIGLLSIL